MPGGAASFYLGGPCVLRHSQRCDDQHLLDVLGDKQIDQRRQRANGLAEAHVYPQRGVMVVLNELCGPELVLVEVCVL